MSVARRCAVAVLTATVTFTTHVAYAQGTLNAARELYAAAAYDEALNALNALASGSETISDSGTVALFRINPDDGTLHASGEVLEVGSPVCIKMLPVK